MVLQNYVSGTAIWLKDQWMCQLNRIIVVLSLVKRSSSWSRLWSFILSLISVTQSAVTNIDHLPSNYKTWMWRWCIAGQSGRFLQVDLKAGSQCSLYKKGKLSGSEGSDLHIRHWHRDPIIMTGIMIEYFGHLPRSLDPFHSHNPTMNWINLLALSI